MDEQKLPDLTLVTHPDFHVDPDAFRILVLGNDEELENTQDTIGINWPAEPVTLYVSNTQPFAHINWVFHQTQIANIIFVFPWNIYEWAWPLVCASKAEKYFIVDPDATSTTHSLKLTYPGRVFNTIEEAVQAAIAKRI